MIEQIELCLADGETMTVSPTRVNLVVGPNGAGKSLFLRELRDLLQTNGGLKTQLIAKINRCLPKDTKDMVDWLLDRGLLHDEESGAIYFPNFMPKKKTLLGRDRMNSEGPRKVGLDPLSLTINVGEPGRALTTFLDGKTRLEVAEGGPYNSPAEVPDGCWSYLVQVDDDRGLLQNLVRQDLEYELYLDLNSTPGTVVPRVTREALPPEFDELTTSRELASRYQQMNRLSDLSDGMQAYVGMLIASLVGHWRQLIIDEPEAFLHPPLARTLARRLSTLAKESNHTLWIATHSAEFLMGCIEAGVEVTVLRLGFAEGRARANILANDSLRALFNDPLLRSSRVLQGLFHSAVVVAEGEYDRAFYDEINRRLLDEDTGCRDTLFVCAQGKNAVHRIARSVRQSGIPAAVIVDLDIIYSGWKKLLPELILDPEVRDVIEVQMKAAAAFTFELVPGSQKVRRVDILTDEQQAQLRALQEALMAFGVFVVLDGGLESWLPELGVQERARSKGQWVTQIFERLGADANAEAYVRPTGDGVWGFMEAIGDWLREAQHLAGTWFWPREIDSAVSDTKDIPLPGDPAP